MNTNLFTVSILTLAYLMIVFHTKVREFYSPVRKYKIEMVKLEEKVQRERLKHLNTSYEFQDFRSYVATLLPEKIKELGPGEKSYPVRTLASTLQKQVNENLVHVQAKSLIDDGKRLFREKKYERANEKFNQLIRRHPYSAYIAEAMLLLVEGNFALGNYDQVISYANKMLDVYPESELTGYALIRLGKVYELQDRHSDATDIYKTVILSFPDRGLASAARNSLGSIEY